MTPPRVERVLGGLVAALLGALCGVICVFYAPLRWAPEWFGGGWFGGLRVPLSPVVAVVGNLTLVWFAYRVTNRRWPAVLPAVAWFAVMVLGSGATSEGDVLLAGNNWVGLATIFAGSIAYAIGGYRLILRQPLPPRAAESPQPPVGAGS